MAWRQVLTPERKAGGRAVWTPHRQEEVVPALHLAQEGVSLQPRVAVVPPQKQQMVISHPARAAELPQEAAPKA